MNGHSWIAKQYKWHTLFFVTNYLKDMKHRLKPTTMENKRFIIEKKLFPYFGKQKICDIDTIKIRKWQNKLISYRDENGNPFSQTYLKTVNNQLSALMNYAVSHYYLASNPCKVAGSIGKSKALYLYSRFFVWRYSELYFKIVWNWKRRLNFLFSENGIRKRNKENFKKNRFKTNHSSWSTTFTRKYVDRTWLHSIRDC